MTDRTNEQPQAAPASDSGIKRQPEGVTMEQLVKYIREELARDRKDEENGKRRI